MNNTFESHGSYICHHGRKGMKWGQHIFEKESRYIKNATEHYNKKLKNLQERVSYREDMSGNKEKIRQGLISRAITRNNQEAKKAISGIQKAISGGKRSWKEYKKANKKSYGLTKMRQRRETANEFNSYIGGKNRRYETSYQRNLRAVIRSVKNEKLSEMVKRRGSTNYSLDKYMSKVASVRKQAVRGLVPGALIGGWFGGAGGAGLGYAVGKDKAFGSSNRGISYNPTNKMYTKDLPAYRTNNRR